MSYLRFESTENNRCFAVVAPVLGEDAIAYVETGGRSALTSTRPLTLDETSSIAEFMRREVTATN